LTALHIVVQFSNNTLSLLLKNLRKFVKLTELRF